MATSRISLLLALICPALFVSLLAGCDSGPKLVPAGGTVTYNGKPVPGADVVFMPDAGSSPSIGRTSDDGRFTLSTGGKPGVPPGGHKVAITAVRQKRAVSEAESIGMTSEQIAANHESIIPIKYNNLISSGLTASVADKSQNNEFAFDLK
jgi:hypothetical protein